MKASVQYMETLSSKSTGTNSMKKLFPRKKSSRKSTGKSPKRKMTNTAKPSSSNSMTTTVPNSSNNIASPLSTTKKPMFCSKTFSLSSTNELRTWKSQKIHPKNHQSRFKFWKKNSERSRNKLMNKRKWTSLLSLTTSTNSSQQ